MPEDPLVQAMAQLRKEIARTVGREQEIARLYEDAILRIRLSSALQKERLQAYVDGATLAAFQVHSIQIKFLEHPPLLKGWAFWGDILITFALDSTVVGKLVGGVTVKIFKQISIQRAALRAIPLSKRGQALVNRAKVISASADKYYPRVDEVMREGERKFMTWPTVKVDKGVLLPFVSDGEQSKLLKKALSEELGKEQIKDLKELYHTTVGRLIAGESNAEKDIRAVLKSKKRAYDVQKNRSDDPLDAGDSPTAYVLSAVQQYGAVLRYNQETVLAEVESSLRGRYIEVEALEPLLAAWPLDEMHTKAQGSNVPADLEELRQRYAIAFESVIWAKLYNYETNSDEHIKGVFEIAGVPEHLVRYWVSRLLPGTDQALGKDTPSHELGDKMKTQRIHDYMRMVGRHLRQNGVAGPG